MAIRSNGKDAVALTVFRRLGGNALEVSRQLSTRAGRRGEVSAPPAWTIQPVYDQGLPGHARPSPTSAMRSSSAASFSVLILLMFLKSLRATIIAALSIPLSLDHQLRLPAT